MKKCACIDTLYTEIDFYERFKAAKNDGFELVEFWDYRNRDLNKMKKSAEDAGITISGFNGDADFSLVDPTHKDDYLKYLKQSLETAKFLGALSVTIHSNALGDGGIVVNHYTELSHTTKLCSMYDILSKAAKMAESYKIRLNLEALNITTDHVGNFLENTDMAVDMIKLINSDYLKILYDAYHMQLNEGKICDTITKSIDYIGHIHIADAPGRNEPGTGEINYKNIFKCLETQGYKYGIGFELFPKTNTQVAVEAIMKL